MTRYKFAWKTIYINDSYINTTSRVFTRIYDADYLDAAFSKYENSCLKKENKRTLLYIYIMSDNYGGPGKTIYDLNTGFTDCIDFVMKYFIDSNNYISPLQAFTMLKMGATIARKNTDSYKPTVFDLFDTKHNYVGSTERIEYQNSIKWYRSISHMVTDTSILYNIKEHD